MYSKTLFTGIGIAKDSRRRVKSKPDFKLFTVLLKLRLAKIILTMF